MATIAEVADEATVTQRLLGSATVRGASPAVLGLADEQTHSYLSLAEVLQRAAAGLAWRGVRPRDVVGAYLPDAASYLIACHAIRAAGAVPCPVASHLAVSEIAGQLADCGARMLITAPPLTSAALAAADRSWVRQVITFGEAPAATPFAALLTVGALQPTAARPHDLALLAYQRRQDGTLGPAGQSHLDLAAELAELSRTAAVTDRDVVLATPPAGDGRAYTALLDHALLSGAAVVAAAAGELAAAASQHRGTAAIVPAGLQPPARPELRVFAVAS